MTRRRGKKQQLNWLQLSLGVGALAASLLGTGLVAHKDAAQAAPPATVVVVPAAQGAGTEEQRLQAVPTAASRPMLRPVARSRSSR